MQVASTKSSTPVPFRSEAEVPDSSRPAGIDEIDLVREARHALVGRLASSAAHGLNNVLTVVLAQAELLAEELDDDPHRSSVTAIREAAERATALTRRLHALTREPETVGDPARVGPTVQGLQDILHELLPSNVKLQLALDAELAVTLSEVDLQQVVLHLCIAARDAMSEGGVLGISAHAPTDAEGFVRLRVSHAGAPAPVELLAAFERARPDVRAGLGLAAARELVARAGGRARVRGRSEHGTTYEVDLPAPPRAGEPR